MTRAQLGLAHSYSRAKVKFNVHKVDNMVRAMAPRGPPPGRPAWGASLHQRR